MSVSRIISTSSLVAYVVLDDGVIHAGWIYKHWTSQWWLYAGYQWVLLSTSSTVLPCYELWPFLLLPTGVSGSDISLEHCRVECKGHRVTVHPLGGDCFVNHKRLKKPTRLSQGTVPWTTRVPVCPWSHSVLVQSLVFNYINWVVELYRQNN